MEYDNALVIETILTSAAANNRMSELHLIHQFLGHDWRVRFQHIPRAHNKVADHMIKLLSLYCSEVWIFTEIPVSVKNLLQADINSLANIN